MKNGKKEAIIRIVVLAVTLANAILTASGKNPIPFDQHAVTECLSYILSGAAAVWAWWKNNNMTYEAEQGSRITYSLKEDKKNDKI